MAAGQPLRPQADTAEQAVSFNRLDHVFRATGIKAARRGQHGGDPALVYTNECDERTGRGGAHIMADGRRCRRVPLCAIQRCELHVAITRPKARSISSNVAFSTARLGFITMSHLQAILLR